MTKEEGENRPLLAVVTPTVRRPDLLRRSVGSCFTGTAAVDEVVVVHAHPDNPAVARGTEPWWTRVLELYHSESLGPSAARNLGWQHTTAKWVLFLDDDDYLLPGAVAQAKRTVASVGEGVGVVAFGAEVERPGRREVCLPGPVVRKYGSPFWAEIGTLLVRRDALERVGGLDPRLRLGENRDLLIRILSEYEAVAVDIPVVRLDYSHSGERLSRSRGTSEANEYVLQKNLDLFSSRADWLRSACLHVSCHAAAHGQVDIAARWYLY